MAQRVAVLGGGIGGLTAAHELIKRGFEVTVYEREDRLGGKSRSNQIPGSGTGGRQALPSEHGFRFFPGFYQHLPDVMSSIPMPGGRSCADFLVPTQSVLLTRFGKPGVELPTSVPTDIGDFLKAGFNLLTANFGLQAGEATHFLGKLWQVMTSCGERRLDELETISWWDYLEADSQSESFQHLLAEGLSRSLVAARAQEASARTIGQVQVHLLSDILLNDRPTDRVLQGPTSDVFITPWLDHLAKSGVRMVTQREVVALNVSGGKISSASLRPTPSGEPEEISADWYVAALPIESMAPLISSELAKLDPTLSHLGPLSGDIRWMSGCQFYLSSEVRLNHGHTLHVDTPWALTSISQFQFWPQVRPEQLGNGQVKTLLSVVISDWDKPGFNGKLAQQCTRQEVLDEVWAQLKKSININKEWLRDQDIVTSYLDQALKLEGDPPPGPPSNKEPLFINRPNSWPLRPEVVTRVPNLVLAADYVQTRADLACMECACEAGRHAVNALLIKTKSTRGFATTYKLEMPFQWLRAADRIAYNLGIDWSWRGQELG